MLRTSLTRTTKSAAAVARGRAGGPTRGFAAAAEERESSGGGFGTLLALGAIAAAGYYIYANDLLDDIIVRWLCDKDSRARGVRRPGRGEKHNACMFASVSSDSHTRARTHTQGDKAANKVEKALGDANKKVRFGTSLSRKMGPVWRGPNTRGTTERA